MCARLTNGEGDRGSQVTDLAKVEIEFSIVSDRGECQLPGAFSTVIIHINNKHAAIAY